MNIYIAPGEIYFWDIGEELMLILRGTYAHRYEGEGE